MKRHAKSLVNLIKSHFGAYKYITGVEVGVWQGDLSADLLVHLPRLTLYMVDPWELLVEGTPTMMKKMDEVIAARKKAEYRTQFYSRVVCHMTSLQAAHDLASKQFSFVFIDACHLYESVRDDIIAWWSLVVPNGLICGHDYNGVGDQRHGWGVKRAVDERFGSKVNVLPGNIWFVQKDL